MKEKKLDGVRYVKYFIGEYQVSVVIRYGFYYWRNAKKGKYQDWQGAWETIQEAVADARLKLDPWKRPLNTLSEKED